eukprot:COSAG06_NODE_15211_length_1089_cov_51.883838_2_plen_120_part_00
MVGQQRLPRPPETVSASLNSWSTIGADATKALSRRRKPVRPWRARSTQWLRCTAHSAMAPCLTIPPSESGLGSRRPLQRQQRPSQRNTIAGGCSKYNRRSVLATGLSVAQRKSRQCGRA